MSTTPPAIPSSSIEPGTLWVFTPSRTDPAHLESILVQRQDLLQDAVDRVVESASTGHKHHQLFVGPRGCGKSHLVSLIVSRLGKDDRVRDRLRIAWLNEDETSTTLLDLLLKIHAALESRYPAEFQEAQLAEAYELKPAQALDFVSARLLSALGKHTLLVVAENLDALFNSLGDSGQKQLRAFIQESSLVCFVVTAQRLVESLTHRDNPFHGFFQTEHLKPLNVSEATDLLKNIATLHGKQDVVEFLSTSRGRSRVQALHHLSGGNHRIYIVLSQFITRETMDSLLAPFMKMVDELTPYYQERLRWLPAQQRKIIEHLCRAEGTVAVKDIAKRLFATPQTISSQLQDLREKGYVTANQRGRESLYEISEPLMRICVEVKETSSHEPLRLLVDFLRVWYDDKDLDERLGAADPASVSRRYFEAALLKNKKEGNLRVRLLLAELDFTGYAIANEQTRTNLATTTPESFLVALHCVELGDGAGAIACFGEAISEEPDPIKQAPLRFSRGHLLKTLGRDDSALDDFNAAIETPGIDPFLLTLAHLCRGLTRATIGELDYAINDFTFVANQKNATPDQVAEALLQRAFAYDSLNQGGRAAADYTTIIELREAPTNSIAKALFHRGLFHYETKNFDQAIADLTKTILIPTIPADLVAYALNIRALVFGESGEKQKELDDYNAAINLPNAPIKVIASTLRLRGLIYAAEGKTQKALEDFTSVINLPNAPLKEVVQALNHRALAYFQMNQKEESAADFSRLSQVADASVEMRIDAHLALTLIHFSEGRWNQGFEDLEKELALTHTQPSSNSAVVPDVIGSFFAAGLNPKGRKEIAARLLQVYGKHQFIPALGEVVVQHMGYIFQAGAPFPSTDNLEGWAAAWEQAGETVPDFRLSLRLLRTTVNFIKAGGQDRTLLLDLAAPERAIVEQALGLSTEPA